MSGGGWAVKRSGGVGGEAEGFGFLVVIGMRFGLTSWLM
jgi:hypothetical protein